MATFVIPAGTAPRLCRGCGAPVYWTTTKAGKKLALELGHPGTFSPAHDHDGAGVAHWATCPKAETFRRPPTPNPGRPEPRHRKGLD